MGFHRTRQPQAFTRAEAVAAITDFLRPEEIAAVARVQDPFLLDNDCFNPAGHDPIASCGEIVCSHCAKVFWR